MKAMLGLVNGLVTTRNTRAGKSPAVVGRAKKHEKFVMRSAYLVRCALPCLIGYLFLCFTECAWGQFVSVEAMGNVYISEHRCGEDSPSTRRYFHYSQPPGGIFRWSPTIGSDWSAIHQFDGTVKFILHWPGEQSPSQYVALSYYEGVSLYALTPPTHGSAEAKFEGNLLKGSIRASGGCGDPRGCGNTDWLEKSEIHGYYVSWRRVSDGWKAELTVPFRISASVSASCPPPPLDPSFGYIDAESSVSIVDPKFVWMIASNEPSYSKGEDCTRKVNNSEGRLDEREGDTAIELRPVYRAIYNPYDVYPYRYTEWYLGSHIVYTRQLVGDWCPGDCPLNEWWICGKYYKDNLFHEFTSVDAVIGFPKSDCEDWFIGAEEGWNDAPSDSFWERPDVQERLKAIKLPYEYSVMLKVTDQHGSGFTDSAVYTMRVHPPVELTKMIAEYKTYLPEEGRSHPGERNGAGETRLTNWVANLSDRPLKLAHIVESSDTFSTSHSGGIECSLSGDHQVPIIGMKLIGAKLNLNRTVTTTSSFRVGSTVEYTVPPRTRGAWFSQRGATIQLWEADYYDFHGYTGSGRVRLQADIWFEYTYVTRPLY
jgi:hypothetical protein